MPKPHILRTHARKYLDADDSFAALSASGVQVAVAADVRTVTLPSDAGVRATFQGEGGPQKFKKLFTGELQVGDAEFDDAVFISTDTKDATASLLDTNAFRAAILQVVQRGGHARIDGASVVIAGGTDRLDATIAAYVLAYSQEAS